MPAEKKITVFRAVDEEFRSNATGEHVKKSFWETVGDVVGEVVYTAGEVVATAVEKAKDVAEWIWDHIPFPSGSGGCYITTAVCKKDSKPDNCYELYAFRSFRDHWLSYQSDGPSLIRRYYRLAPQIVKLIDKEENAGEIYDSIRRNYLTPCLRYIEQGDMANCKRLYSEMVNQLADEYLLWA